jgi:hypothetical protein
MWRVICHVTAEPVRSELPREISVKVHDNSSVMPTHMLACIINPPYPEHECKLHFSQLITSYSPLTARTCPLFLLPIAHRIPIPSNSLSYHSISPVLQPSQRFPTSCIPKTLIICLGRYFLTCPPSFYTTPSTASDANPALLHFSKALAMKCSTILLFRHAIMAIGLWRNVCALGVADQDLWHVLYLAWEIILSAIVLATGDPQLLANV